MGQLQGTILTAIVCLCTKLNGAEIAPIASASLSLDGLFPACVQTTLVFASEETVAIARYPGSNGTLSGTIAAIDWNGSRLQLSSTRDLSLDRGSFIGELFAAAHGKVLSLLTRRAQLFSTDLKQKIGLPTEALKPPVSGANVVAAFEALKVWKLYRLIPQISLIREGGGEILSFSDEFVASRKDGKIHIETVAGREVDSFEQPPKTRCHVEIVGPGRLLLTGCGSSSIVNFGGKELVRIPAPDGWGFRVGLSNDGGRAV